MIVVVILFSIFFALVALYVYSAFVAKESSDQKDALGRLKSFVSVPVNVAVFVVFIAGTMSVAFILSKRNKTLAPENERREANNAAPRATLKKIGLPIEPNVILLGAIPDRAQKGTLSSEDREKKRRLSFDLNAVHLQSFSPITTPLASCLFIYDKIDKSKPAKAGVLLPGHTASIKDRFVGAMVGLAIGDAYGSPYEFMSPEAVRKIGLPDSHTHAGRFSLRKGAWTDDTAMALCLLASGIEKDCFAPKDVLDKFKKWIFKRYMNFDAQITDFGITTERALIDNFINVRSMPSWGNAVIMRLAPVAMQYISADVEPALRIAAASGAMTAGDHGALDFPAFMAYILRGFMKGTLAKCTVCRPDFIESHLGWYFDKHPYGANFATLAQSWPNPIVNVGVVEEGSCHVVLSRAVYAFCSEDSLIGGLKAVVGFGNDTDTAAAVFGQIYGAYYGIENVAGRGGKKENGLKSSILYDTTERIDAIYDLCLALWNNLLGTANPSSALIKSGTVQDINPCFRIPGYKDISGVSVVEV